MSKQELSWHHGDLIPVQVTQHKDGDPMYIRGKLDNDWQEWRRVDDVLIENDRLKAENERLREALEELIQLKDWNDRNGKDEHYLNARERAWTQAREALQQEGGDQ